MGSGFLGDVLVECDDRIISTTDAPAGRRPLFFLIFLLFNKMQDFRVDEVPG